VFLILELKMNKIDCSNAFLNAIQSSKKRLICKTDGTWYLEGRWEGRLMRLVRWFIRPLEDIRLRRITQAFATVLDQVESQPVEFSSKNSMNYALLVDASNKLNAYLNDYVSNGKPSYSLKWPLINDISRLQQRIIALKYRCESVNGGENPNTDEIDATQFNSLKNAAEKWKNQAPFPAELTNEEEHFIEEACRFPLFVDHLLSNPALQEPFFKWTIRYHNPVQAFVEFPETQRKLSVSLLSSRVSLYNLLKVQGSDAEERAKMGTTSKDLTIPCHLDNHNKAVPCSILDGAKQITFKGGYTLSWQEIFKIFERKNQDFGNLEAFPTGIDNWSTSKLGWWNAKANEYVCVDLTQNDWWMQIPSTQELSLEEAQQRYYDFRQNNEPLNCDGINWVYTIMMTRRSRSLELGGTHAYGEIAIPVEDASTGSKKYKVITLSMFPATLPQSFWEIPKAVAGTFPAVVASPDLSIYVLSRERFGPSYEMQQKEGFALMDIIKEQIQQGRDGTLGYQMLTLNCRVFSEGIIREVLKDRRVPADLSETDFWDSEPRGAVGTVFNLIKRTPLSVRKRLTHVVFYPAGSSMSHRVRVNGQERPHSLYEAAPWDSGILGAPSVYMRNEDQRKAALQGSLLQSQQDKA
jgi:hypothetical protein